MTSRGGHPDELISASLSGDLTDAERAELDNHLARCERCRATLVAFKTDRRILAALPPADAPRDLSARVRAGIESGRFGVPWWRRPGHQVQLLASATVFTAVVLSVVYFGHLLPAPVGQASGSPVATVSSVPSASAVASTVPNVGPSAPPTFLAPGQLGYLELSGASLQPSRLSFIKDATGASMSLGTVSGPPVAASLSPDGRWLAYITRKGESGANEVWVLDLAGQQVVRLGCSLAEPFADRLTWSPHGDLLAFTIAAVDLGSTNGCPKPNDPDGTTRVWLFRTYDRTAAPLMEAGTDSYTASFERVAIPDAPNRLWISHAGATPFSELVAVMGGETLLRVDGMFLPLVAPDGNRVLFWRGAMSHQPAGSGWSFIHGGMPFVSGDRTAVVDASVWDGEQLFTDLAPVGGEAFAYGAFAWSPDSNHLAFWHGAWTGAPQSADGTYPMDTDLYVGSISGGLLSATSRFAPDLTAKGTVVDATFGSTPPNIGRGFELAVMISSSSAGIGEPPSAKITIFTVCCGGENIMIGGGVSPPPWDGPAVFGH